MNFIDFNNSTLYSAYLKNILAGENALAKKIKETNENYSNKLIEIARSLNLSVADLQPQTKLGTTSEIRRRNDTGQYIYISNGDWRYITTINDLEQLLNEMSVRDVYIPSYIEAVRCHKRKIMDEFIEWSKIY